MTRRRLGALAVVLAVLTGVGVLAVAGLQGSLVYYRTPSEVQGHPPADRFRLAGVVVPGTLVRSGADVRFRLTDGAADIAVDHRGDTPAMLREGQGAVVEGTLDRHGVFHSHLVMVRHSNDYTPPSRAAG